MDGMQIVNWVKQALIDGGVFETVEDILDAAAEPLSEAARQAIKDAASRDPKMADAFQKFVGASIDVFVSPSVLSLAEKFAIIVTPLSASNIPGTGRFADKAPTTALAPVTPAGEGEEGLGIEVGGEEFKPEGEAVALMPGQHLLEGKLPATKPKKIGGTAYSARENLQEAVEELKAKKRGGISHDILDKIVPLFDGIVSGKIVPPKDSDVLGRDVARQLINVLARHPIEAKIWIESVVGANFERGFDQGSFIIPEAKLHEDIYTKEHVPEEGTTVQTSEPDSFKKARDKYTELTAFMTEYQDIIGELAKARPGLFGTKALERLNRRYLAIQEIYATLSAEERNRLFKEAKEADVLPYAWPVSLEEDDRTILITEEIEELEAFLDRDALDERKPRWKNGMPPIDNVEDFELGLSEDGWLNDDGTPRFETVDGILLDDLKQELDPMQRLLDLHSAAMARDMSIIITAIRVLGAMPKEARAAHIDKMPDLKEMEKMWRPNEEGMKAPGRAAVLDNAGLLPGKETPMLALPASVAGRYVTGNANLLTAGQVDQAVKDAEGAVLVARGEGEGSTALTVVDRHSKDNTLLKLGALMHELKKAALEGSGDSVSRTIRAMEQLMGRREGTLLVEFATGRGKMAEIFGKNFGAEAKGRVVELAKKATPEGRAAKRDTDRPFETKGR